MPQEAKFIYLLPTSNIKDHLRSKDRQKHAWIMGVGSTILIFNKLGIKLKQQKEEELKSGTSF